MASPVTVRPGQLTISRSKLLMVEGENERRFFGTLLRRLGAHDTVQVIPYHGRDWLREYVLTLPNLTKFETVESLGITRDADQSAVSAFQSVCDSLEEARLDVPAQTLTATEGKPRVSVFILPDCESPGMLETLCLRAVRDDPAMECVKQYLRCLKDTAGMTPKNPDKARAHAFLASRERPELRVGEAAEAGHWQLDAPVFAPLSSFLLAL